MNIISGRALSVYNTVALTLGQAKKPNRDGKISRFVVISMKDSYSPLSKTRRTIIFDDDYIGLVDTLAKYVDKSIVDPHGGQVISLAAFKASPDAALYPILEWPGMMPVVLPLRKGMCYANSIDGQRVVDKTGAPVKKDHVTVMVQVRYIREGADRPTYVDGWDDITQLNNIESRFYREPVVQTANVEDDDPIPLQPAPAQPTQQPAQQATQAAQPTQQPAQQATQAAPQMQPQTGTQTPF